MPNRTVLYIVAGVALLFGGLSLYQYMRLNETKILLAKADGKQELLKEQEREAKALKEASLGYDADSAKADDARKLIALTAQTIRAEIADAKRGYTPNPGTPDAKDVVILKQDRLIDQQEIEIQSQDKQLSAQKERADSWKKTSDSYETALKTSKEETEAMREAFRKVPKLRPNAGGFGKHFGDVDGYEIWYTRTAGRLVLGADAGYMRFKGTTATNKYVTVKGGITW